MTMPEDGNFDFEAAFEMPRIITVVIDDEDNVTVDMGDMDAASAGWALLRALLVHALPDRVVEMWRDDNGQYVSFEEDEDEEDS